MFSLSKIALFSLISFATLALAIPAPEPRQENAKTLIADANIRLEQAMFPVGSSAYLSDSVTLLYAHGLRIACVNSANATVDDVGPIIVTVTEIVIELTDALGGASLSGCTSQDVLGLISALLMVLSALTICHFPSDAYLLWYRLSLDRFAWHVVQTLVYWLLLVTLC